MATNANIDSIPEIEVSTDDMDIHTNTGHYGDLTYKIRFTKAM